MSAEAPAGPQDGRCSSRVGLSGARAETLAFRGFRRPSARLAGSGSPSTSSPAPEPTLAWPAGTTSAPGRAEATGSPSRQRRLPPVSDQPPIRVLAATRATDRVPQRQGAVSQVTLRRFRKSGEASVLLDPEATPARDDTQ